ncbi:MAG: acetyl/propionyl-CoA carboxylase alpha subunit/acetyl-CoA carboxylase carboxyltransferase component [Paracoccaceae bacterium]|jgi:acetyl/propionyl-CoA carboxylase alpha subunit/acetyl-CoA carboxylase carboxyltransferase component
MIASPPFARVLIANRGEIACRLMRTCADMGVETVAVFPADDAASLHARRADRAVELPGVGARAYLDIDAVISAATAQGCDAVHPGYGFLAENVAFAEAVEGAGMAFIGPRPAGLALFGDKGRARALAAEHGVPTLPGTGGEGGAAEPAIHAFFAALPDGAAMMIKAVHGGGGRGMRAVTDASQIPEAFARCASEAEAAFGDGALFAERFIARARHLEVQILGDGTGACVHVGERECTLQRRNQKVLEIAPSPSLTEADRDLLTGHALILAQAGRYRGLGTFEFLMDIDAPAGANMFFIEANPRIQVEHTVTEAVFGLDLVALQMQVCGGATLAGLGVTQASLGAPVGFAIQARVNLEKMDAAGNARPSGGTLSAYDPPSGPGVRVDGFAYAGYRTSSAYDSLLAKVIVHVRGDFDAAARKTARALAEFRIEGAATNLAWLRALLAHGAVRAGAVTTRFIEAEAQALFDAAAAMDAPLFPHAEAAAPEAATAAIPEGAVAVTAPMQATLVALDVAPGDRVRAGAQVAVLEAMKMQHSVTAPQGGTVRAVLAAPGDTLASGAPVLLIDPSGGMEAEADAVEDIDLNRIRPDLADLRERIGAGRDENRPEAVAKRHARGQSTARENLGAICDPGAFLEYGALATAAQRSRRTLADLIANTTGDGVVTGIGSVNGDLFGEDAARCAFAVYDYMVLAGTQGQRNHKKQDRLFELAGKWKLPVILLAEGGGGRPGDVDRFNLAGLDCTTFGAFARLSGQAPLVGVVSGRCFAGNAALLGCCDVIIADESSNIGMAGPAMIEGGGLGVYRPEEIGPIGVQSANGVVDIRVKDEAAACAAAKQYISYFQGDLPDWTAPDQRLLRFAIPENRLRVHEVRDVIDTLADDGSVLELRREFGVGMVTALIRIEGRPYGLIANNSKHLGGAIDGPAADKASRFMQLCDAFGLPIVSLCDTPGFMVGPEAEKTALVRHVCRMFVTAASLSVPVLGVVLRKGYGLGAMAMVGGGFHESMATVSWPTGEFGGMGLEGAVRLGFAKELDAAPDEAAKQALFDKLLAELYENGKAISIGSVLEVDAVIDPVETRSWISGAARAAGRPAPTGGRRPFIDTW